MLGLVLLGILASVVVLGTVSLLMFAEGAYAGPSALHIRLLPLLDGASLKAWAALRSRFATGTWLATHPERIHSDELARRIEADAGHLLDQAVFQESPESRGVQPCRLSVSIPQATAPEVFAIAAELRKLPSGQLQNLKSQVSLAAQMGSGTCPLITKQGMCLCAIARPIGCRGRCLAGFDSSADAMEWAKALEEGMIEGLQTELEVAGLDGRRYDINQALARVLTDPSSESRWQRGERLMLTEVEAVSPSDSRDRIQ